MVLKTNPLVTVISQLGAVVRRAREVKFVTADLSWPTAGSCPGRLPPRRRTHNVGCYGPRRRALHTFPSRKYRQLPGLAVKPRPWRVPERPRHSHLGCRRRNWPKGILLSTGSGPLMSQVCCHVHGIYPYCYIEYKGNLIPDDGTP